LSFRPSEARAGIQSIFSFDWALALEDDAEGELMRARFCHWCHCEERSDEAIQNRAKMPGLLRFARNDGEDVFASYPRKAEPHEKRTYHEI
jgi:hypothetical protein